MNSAEENKTQSFPKTPPINASRKKWGKVRKFQNTSSLFESKENEFLEEESTLILSPDQESNLVVQNAGEEAPPVQNIHTPLSNPQSREISTNNMDADISVIRKSNQFEIGRVADAVINVPNNPFQNDLLHTDPIWRRDFDITGTGYKLSEFSIALYDTSSIKEPPEFEELLPEPLLIKYRFDPWFFYVDIFFQKRMFSQRNTRQKSKPDLRALTMAWNDFISFISKAWYKVFSEIRESYISHTLNGAKMRVHMMCVEQGLYCAVSVEQKCPFCYKTSIKMPESEKMNQTQCLKLAIIDLKTRLSLERYPEPEEEMNGNQYLITDYMQDYTKLLRQQQIATLMIEINQLKATNNTMIQHIYNIEKEQQKMKEYYGEQIQSLIQDLKRRKPN